ncbi:galectin-3-like isoform X2 [Eriocheir sinensis]|uniref:galectin-3-like isoform X2 n=1 Tax=Eriocheir sinensis TaxID=95602 RepID=UPI0021CA7344|nr:galectin-3-like isoform X2 [Eriocheir sinensis]
MNNNGYQPAGQTVVVVNTNRRTPQFVQQGVRVGGMMLGLACFVCMGLFGAFFILCGIIMLATTDYDDDFWDDDSPNPLVIVGSIFLVIGVLLLSGGVAMCMCARKKYNNLQGDGVSNPGRVINPPPGGQEQPVTSGYPGQPQPAVYPGQPPSTGYPGQPQPAGYGQPQPYGYPGQPQPSGYPAQPAIYPELTSAYPGPPAPFSQPPGGYAAQPDPPYPEKMSVTNVTSEYMPPPPTAPDPSSQPPPYQP